jgi:cell shape-determining protein MreD
VLESGTVGQLSWTRRAADSRRRPWAAVAALAAGVASGIVEAAVAAVLPLDIPRPHVSLAVVAVVAVAARFDVACLAAVAAGLTLDAVLLRPLGLTATQLLVPAAFTAVAAAHLPARARFGAVVAVAPATAVERLLEAALAGSTVGGVALARVSNGVVLDVVIAAVLVIPVAAATRRRRPAVEP